MRTILREPYFVVLVAGVLAAGCGAPADGPGAAGTAGARGRAAQAATVCPEPTTPDDRGEPRNADGHLRECWPGDANCYCDDGNDCYAQDGYVPCDPNSGAPAPVPPDSGTPDPGTPGAGTPGGGGATGATTALPDFDAATAAHVRDLVARGQARGNARDVVAKIGDSITESASYLMDCGNGWYTLDQYAALEPTIQYFSEHTLADGSNPLNRASRSATAGWTTVNALAGGDPASPLTTELDAIQPQWAVVMYGTNDVDHYDVGTYAANLGRIVDLIESRAAVAVLSTIPDRLDGAPSAASVPTFNGAIRDLAGARHLPLIDFWAALQTLPNHGISTDGIHPDVYQGSNGCVFTPDALQYGYNVRNLTTLQMLDRLRTGY